MELLGFKKCSVCGKYLPFSCFHKKSEASLKLTSRCKECSKKYIRKYYKEHTEQVKEQVKDYYEKNKKQRILKICEYQRKPMPAWKDRIRRETRQLILQGLILHPGCCEECGVVAEDTTIHIHHLTYVRPDKVLFLCQACHSKWHRENPDPPEPSVQFVNKWYETYKSYPEEE